MKDGWQKRNLGSLVHKLETIDPRKAPNTTFNYIDVSSVSREEFRVDNVSATLGKNAPSRARRLVRTGDVIFATIRPTLKRIAYISNAHNEAICSTGYFVLRAKSDLNPTFLYYYLQSNEFIDAMGKLERGTSYPAVSDADVRAHTLELPPIVEQKRIVSILDQALEVLDRARANAEANLESAKELFDSFQGKVFEFANIEFKEAPLSALATFSQGRQVPVGDQFPESSDGLVRFIRIVDYTQQNTEPRYIEDPGTRYHVSEQDIVMVRYGSPGLIGRGKAGVIANNMFRINADNSIVSNDFLSIALQANSVQNYLGSRGSSTMPALNFKHLDDVIVRYPSLLEQEKVAALVTEMKENVERLNSVYRSTIANLSQLRQSILQKAFSGELT